MEKLGIYIHIPFCRRKCSYCDFYSIVPEGTIIDQYVKALLRELKLFSAECKQQYLIDTLYIGGGTPTVLSAGQVEEIMQAVRHHFILEDNPEISIEVNPESLTREHLNSFKNSSVNRISMGVQTFNNKILKYIGRITNKEEIFVKMNMVRDMGFSNVSFDLIFGLPYQDLKVFKTDLKTALRFKPKHLSIYSLILNKDTPLYKKFEKDPKNFPDDGLTAREYIYAVRILEEQGLQQYEISNFAFPAFQSGHNLKYWHLKPVLGVGASAVSTIHRTRWKNPDDISQYLKWTQAEKYYRSDTEKIDDLKYYNEKVMLKLRLKEGISQEDLNEKERGFLDQKRDAIRSFKEHKFLCEEDNRIFLTTAGVLLSNRIIAELMMDKNEVLY
ncbi:MAG: radical SAM family heme chaperone HemW [Spirochaetes bacterium]|nr:radical SAM family heme chaperone HemW [Spirochaetota bacterium]